MSFDCDRLANARLSLGRKMPWADLRLTRVSRVLCAHELFGRGDEIDRRHEIARFAHLRSAPCCVSGGLCMSSNSLYRTNAEDCLRMAQKVESERERSFWLNLAQSWLQLADRSRQVVMRKEHESSDT